MLLLLDDDRIVVGVGLDSGEAGLDHHHKVLEVAHQLVLAGDAPHGGHELALSTEERDGSVGQLERNSSLDNLYHRLGLELLRLQDELLLLPRLYRG